MPCSKRDRWPACAVLDEAYEQHLTFARMGEHAVSSSGRDSPELRSESRTTIDATLPVVTCNDTMADRTRLDNERSLR